MRRPESSHILVQTSAETSRRISLLSKTRVWELEGLYVEELTVVLTRGARPDRSNAFIHLEVLVAKLLEKIVDGSSVENFRKL